MGLQLLRFLCASALLINIYFDVWLGFLSPSIGHFTDINEFIILYVTFFNFDSLPSTFFLPSSQLKLFNMLFIILFPLSLAIFMIINFFIFFMFVNFLQRNFLFLNVFLGLLPFLVTNQLIYSLNLLLILLDFRKH